MPMTRQQFEKKILNYITEDEQSPLPYRRLLKLCKVSDDEFKLFTTTLENMKKDGKITEVREGFTAGDTAEVVPALIIKLGKTFGFARRIDNDEEIFIPGRFLKGAMNGDTVAVKINREKYENNSAEGEVVRVTDESFSQFTGNIVIEFGKFKIIPDTMSKFAIEFENPEGVTVREGDKVLAQITKRGLRHSEHQCRIISNFGSSQRAAVCAMSVLELEGLTLLFPDEVVAQAKEISSQATVTKEVCNRLDLRSELIFTIDGADTKDIDDAVSVEKTEKGYRLGVHIADVSHYVQPKTPLDNEAFERGTSVYYANRVIPMLPAELSNGICSLNPDVDRLAFSAIVELDEEGNIVDYRFAKTVIRSRVKGVYSELNDILNGTADEAILRKYSLVCDKLPLMAGLAEILHKKRRERGAPELETSESKLIIDENDVCVGVKVRTRGFSEEMIEDFMLVANEAAARFGTENGLSFVYRVHENPAQEKIDNLCQTLSLLGLTIPNHKTGVLKPKHMSEILEQVKGTDKSLVVNNLVLRSMAKAKYSVEPIGHYGLVLSDYAHFTSPIRRYPDLTIHRIMSEFLESGSASEANRKYQKFARASAERSTETEMRAMKIERGCEDCYKAEYLSKHLGEEFDGIICSVLEFGMFITLTDTCEGLVRIEDMPQGEYAVTEGIKMKNMTNGVEFKVGQTVKIKVAACDVSSGKVDFVLA